MFFLLFVRTHLWCAPTHSLLDHPRQCLGQHVRPAYKSKQNHKESSIKGFIYIYMLFFLGWKEEIYVRKWLVNDLRGGPWIDADDMRWRKKKKKRKKCLDNIWFIQSTECSVMKRRRSGFASRVTAFCFVLFCLINQRILAKDWG